MFPFKSKFNVKRELGSWFQGKKVFFVFSSLLPSFFEQEGTFLVFDFGKSVRKNFVFLVAFFLYYAFV